MSKAFIGLLLLPEHRAWKPDDAPEPSNGIFTVTASGWLLQTDPGGLARLHNHGTWRSATERDPHSRGFLDDPLYSRLSYSSATSPTIDGVLFESADAPAIPDNAFIIIIIIIDDGRTEVATLRTHVAPVENRRGRHRQHVDSGLTQHRMADRDKPCRDSRRRRAEAARDRPARARHGDAERTAVSSSDPVTTGIRESTASVASPKLVS